MLMERFVLQTIYYDIISLKNDNIYVRLYICSLVSRSLYSLLVVIVHIHKRNHLDTGVKWAAKSTFVV